MDNFFISHAPYERRSYPVVVNMLNKVLTKLSFGYTLELFPHHAKDMSNIEQRINYYHLVNRVLSEGIEGDFVELGSFTGQCGMIFQKVNQQFDYQKQLHLFDTFEMKFMIEGSVEAVLRENFNKAGLQQPVLHKGFFEETVPSQLPDKISFAHIDCGSGGNVEKHKEIVLFCLENIYSRMPAGAICALMDYCDLSIPGVQGHRNPNAGVKLACDAFFANRPEKIISLYANQHAHGYFVKR